MYEVFLNERKIVIAGPGNMPFIKGAVRFENMTTADEIKAWFLDFTESDTHGAVLVHRFPLKLWNAFFVHFFKFVPCVAKC